MAAKEGRTVRVTPEEAAAIAKADFLVAFLSPAGEVSLRIMPASEIPACLGHSGLVPVSIHPVEPVFPADVLDLVIP